MYSISHLVTCKYFYLSFLVYYFNISLFLFPILVNYAFFSFGFLMGVSQPGSSTYSCFTYFYFLKIYLGAWEKDQWLTEHLSFRGSTFISANRYWVPWGQAFPPPLDQFCTPVVGCSRNKSKNKKKKKTNLLFSAMFLKMFTPTVMSFLLLLAQPTLLRTI